MINQTAEKLNIEQWKWWAERAKQTFETKVSKLQNAEEQEAKTTAEELKKIEQAFTPDKKSTQTDKKHTPTTTNNIPQSIKELNRPEAEEWLQKSYTTIQQDIENSDQDKNPIARWLGKFIKRLNP